MTTGRTSPSSRKARSRVLVQDPATIDLTAVDDDGPSPASVAAALGVVGWDQLDPVLLAALALEAPVLLVGEHGTAKTLLVERLAPALGLELRHYNASLLNYDDLVGIPLPDEHGGLRFVGTPGSVWDAEVVFFDEVNRCRPDLQNKLFPIVHERRVAGIDLPKLRHRWAAMNPPAANDDVLGGYLGAEVLDTALADRFWFVVRVPGWGSLSRDDRQRLAAGVDPTVEDGSLGGLVATVRTELDTAPASSDAVVSYVVTLVELLRQAGQPLSPRRARVLVRSILAVDAAARALGRPLGLKAAAELTVLNGLPSWADPTPPSTAQVVAAHVQAWEVSVDTLDPAKRQVLEEPDPVRRIHLAVDLGIDEPALARLVTSALSVQPSDAHRLGLATVVSRALGDHPLTPAAWSSVADLAVRALRPAEHVTQEAPGRRLEAWRAASARLALRAETGGPDGLERAVLCACGPELLAGVDLDQLSTTLHSWMGMLGVTG